MRGDIKEGVLHKSVLHKRVYFDHKRVYFIRGYKRCTL